jgi:tRNA 2-selenouridine synthase
MALQKITIQTFLQMQNICTLLDVRSPSEYEHAHIPAAKNLPLFSDEERKVVGTLYKQKSREDAIKIGLDFFGPKMRSIVETVESFIAESKSDSKQIVVHCWRGGMRSAAVAWLLDLYGFNVHVIIGGYKAFRNFVLEQFTLSYNFKIIGGYTGSGKTDLLQSLAQNNFTVINLEKIANHKGSALGAIGLGAQPMQEMFENILALELYNKATQLIFLEDESQRIGNLKIPDALWQTMRNCKVLFLEIPFNERLRYLVQEYGNLNKPDLVTAVMRIQKRLGGLETKNTVNFLLEDNFTEAFTILLKYYDKYYLKGLYKRDNANDLIQVVNADTVNADLNVEKIKNFINGIN